MIQIRKYVYCDVVRVHDIQRDVDLAGVQTYTINGSRVVFLNPNPKKRAARTGLHASCGECGAAVRDSCTYCSLACRVGALGRAGVPLRPQPDALSADDDAGESVPPSKRPRPLGADPGAASAHFTRSSKRPGALALDVARPAPGAPADRSPRRLCSAASAASTENGATEGGGGCATPYTQRSGRTVLGDPLPAADSATARDELALEELRSSMDQCTRLSRRKQGSPHRSPAPTTFAFS